MTQIDGAEILGHAPSCHHRACLRRGAAYVVIRAGADRVEKHDARADREREFAARHRALYEDLRILHRHLEELEAFDGAARADEAADLEREIEELRRVIEDAGRAAQPESHVQ